MSPLVFESVGVTLLGKQILTGFTAEAHEGGFTFVVGASGAGKSIVCRAAVGLVPTERGTIRLMDAGVEGRSERALLTLRRRAPYVAQGPALLDWRTLRENASLRRASSARVDAVFAQLGLTPFADRLPHEVGPGTQKRAAIARALVNAPEYLLLDEPTTGLDAEAAGQVLETLEELKRSGASALVVTHDYAALSRLADRVWVVGQGRCLFSGTATEFFASSLPEVRALLSPGETP